MLPGAPWGEVKGGQGRDGPVGAWRGAASDLSAHTWGLVKRAQDHVNNGSSQAQTPGYKAVTAVPLASAPMTDMTCYEVLLSMSIHGSSLYPIIQTMGREIQIA